MVHGTLLTEGSTSTSALDSCTVQEISMVDGSASEALQTCVLYSVLYRGQCTVHGDAPD